MDLAGTHSSSHPPPPPPPPICRRCGQPEAGHSLRDDPTCSDCFSKYVATKVVKRLEAMNRELKGHNPIPPPPVEAMNGQFKDHGSMPPPPFGSMSRDPKDCSPVPPPGQFRYLVGLSFGPSSASLIHILHETLAQRRRKNSRVTYDVLALHVDENSEGGGGHDTAEALLGREGGLEKGEWSPPPPLLLLRRWRDRYPEIRFESVSLRDSRPDRWRRPGTAAAARIGDEGSGPGPLHAFLRDLPSATARADMLQMLVRQQLISEAAERSCSALLLGHTTTALSELALSSVAKGRGFSAPWLINDGPVPLQAPPQGGPQQGGPQQQQGPRDIRTVAVYRPLREVLRSEIITYTTIALPHMSDLWPPRRRPGHAGSAAASGSAPSRSAPAAVVSHRDVGIEEIVARYFAETERTYPSIVANVAKTIGKLAMPAQLDIDLCGVCTLAVDSQGDERWQGEIGGGDAVSRGGGEHAGRICYGCTRSLYN